MSTFPLSALQTVNHDHRVILSNTSLYFKVKGLLTPCYVGLVCHHFDKKKTIFDVLLIPPLLFLICRMEIAMFAEFCTAPRFQLHKKV